jgi:urease accessory protein
VDLALGATAVVWDAIASGRVAMRERWAFAAVENEICIRTSLGESVVERYCLVPGRLSESVGLVRSWDYVASLFVIGDAVDADVWKRLDVVLAAILEQRPGLVLGAVSTPAAPGLVVKFVARTAPDLTETLGAIWAAVRGDLWNLPAPNLRRY